MIFLKDTEAKQAGSSLIGGKASNLFKLKAAGFAVPKWLVIPANEQMRRLPAGYGQLPASELRAIMENAEIPEGALRQMADYFQEDMFLAVRSSAVGEDGREHSYAGQFESYLFVTKDGLAGAIRKVWISAFSDRVKHYTEHNNLEPITGIGVIIQTMLAADVAGVAFAVNPANGDRKEKVVNAVYGLGEGLVSGALDADHFQVKAGLVQARVANKSQRLAVDLKAGGGTVLEAVEPSLRLKACMDERQVLAVCSLLEQCQQVYGYPLDIEFVIVNGQVYLLQARPVTNLSKLPDKSGDYVVWDNSNIIESYPGVTTPLTFSFVSSSYEGAYRLFCGYLGVSRKTVGQHKQVFANTLGLIRGRIYYNLKTWYHMLALLPGYRLNARYMEKMMGVKERFDIPESYRLSKLGAWWAIGKMAIRMLYRFYTMGTERKRFVRLLNRTISAYKEEDFTQKNAHGLMALYLNFERTLLNEWKAPLLNDFFAMIAFGTLEKCCRQWTGNGQQSLHNDLLCGSSDIISTQPVHRCMALSDQVHADPVLKARFMQEDEETIWRYLQTTDEIGARALKAAIDDYIYDFGGRCVGELKLETVSYTQQPTLFVKLLQSYIKAGITSNKVTSSVEDTLRKNAEMAMEKALKGKLIRRWAFNWLLKKTRELVSARENLRYERTRAFGMVREIFITLGKWFYAEGILADARDIFYLTIDELFTYIEGRAVTAQLSGLVAFRKAEFDTYRQEKAPAERFATYGPVYHANNFQSAEKEVAIYGDLRGIGCCPGQVTARVRIIDNPYEAGSLEGDILVTSSTDPGWTTLFPSASGILVERGSLLSHSAIVSREMGIPCIVGITGLLRTLKTGDEVMMDGATGEIKIQLKNDGD